MSNVVIFAGILVMLVVRCLRIDVYRALMMPPDSQPPNTCINGDPHLKLLRAFEHSVFWFLPPFFSRLLITVAVAAAHLLYVCTSQAMAMLGSTVESRTGVNSSAYFLWELSSVSDGECSGGEVVVISPNNYALCAGYSTSTPVPLLLVSAVLTGFSTLVGGCSALYIETKRLPLLVIPALLLDMDEMVSPAQLSVHGIGSFSRFCAVLALLLPHVGVAMAVALRSVLRTEAVFARHDYHRLLNNSPESEGDISETSTLEHKVVKMCEGVMRLGNCALLLFQRKEHCGDGRDLVDLGEEHTQTDRGQKVKEATGDKSVNIRKDVCQGRLLLAVRVLWAGRSRLWCSLYDWMCMRDGRAELQWSTRTVSFGWKRYSWVTLVCHRLLPCLVAAKLFLGNVFVEAREVMPKGVTEVVFCCFAVCRDEQLQCPLLGSGLAYLFTAMLNPLGSLVFSFTFTMLLLCLPNEI